MKKVHFLSNLESKINTMLNKINIWNYQYQISSIVALSI